MASVGGVGVTGLRISAGAGDAAVVTVAVAADVDLESDEDAPAGSVGEVLRESPSSAMPSSASWGYLLEGFVLLLLLRAGACRGGVGVRMAEGRLPEVLRLRLWAGRAEVGRGDTFAAPPADGGRGAIAPCCGAVGTLRGIVELCGLTGLDAAAALPPKSTEDEGSTERARLADCGREKDCVPRAEGPINAP